MARHHKTSSIAAVAITVYTSGDIRSGRTSGLWRAICGGFQTMTMREVDICYDEPVALPETEREEGVEVPVERISPETLRNLISEFVTRQWEEFGDLPSTLEEKIEQVRQQLRERKAKVVVDLKTGTCNIVPVASRKGSAVA